MSKKEKNCLNCRIHWDHDGGCAVCRWEDENHPSLFYQITQSPEVLAEKLVYCVANSWGKLYWMSTVIGEKKFPSRNKAIAATVEKLKEVAK